MDLLQYKLYYINILKDNKKHIIISKYEEIHEFVIHSLVILKNVKILCECGLDLVTLFQQTENGRSHVLWLPRVSHKTGSFFPALFLFALLTYCSQVTCCKDTQVGSFTEWPTEIRTQATTNNRSQPADQMTEQIIWLVKQILRPQSRLQMTAAQTDLDFNLMRDPEPEPPS